MRSVPHPRTSRLARRGIAAALAILTLVALLFACAAPAPALGRPAAPPRWLPPVGGQLDIIAAYTAPEHTYAAGHRGVDLAAESGAPVFAPAGGTVAFAGPVAGRNTISVRVDARTVYALEPVTSELRAGDAVRMGALIGEVSPGGHCSDRCVHLGVRVDNVYVNPAVFLVTRPVLLPW